MKESLETEADGSPQQMQVLATLTPEAMAFLSAPGEDGYSYNHLLPNKYFEIVGRHIYFPLDVDGLKSYIGLDESAPLGAKTPCAYCVSDLICNQAAELYPEDEHLQYLIYKWAELESAISSESFPRKRPSEAVSLKKEFQSVVSSWPIAEIHRLHDIFSGLRASLGERPETSFIPRYVARIHMRDADGELIGQIQKKGEGDILSGSFSAIVVSSNTCFSRLVFTLGLDAGCHIPAACGNTDDPKSHLYRLRNIRMVLKSDVHRQDRNQFEKWGLLYAQTFKDANEIKKLKDNDSKDAGKVSLEDLWSGRVSFKAVPEIPTVWITGAELEKELGQPDESLRHTVRAVALRKSPFSGEMEVLTVTERGDNPGGRTGKPPLVGVPGGMREKNATILQTLCRETENEAQTKSVEKVVALVALHKKRKRPDSEQENMDHWFYVKLDSEAGLSKKMIEGDEIYMVRWLPLSELAACGFQHTKNKSRTAWDVRKVHEQKLLSINHASWLAKILPVIPEIRLPENWEAFRENIRKFQTESYA